MLLVSTYDEVPALVDVAELIGRAHLGVRDSTDDEHDETRSSLDRRLTGPLLVPLTIPGTDRTCTYIVVGDVTIGCRTRNPEVVGSTLKFGHYHAIMKWTGELSRYTTNKHSHQLSLSSLWGR